MAKTRTLLIVALMLVAQATVVLAQDDLFPNRFVVPGDNLSIGYPHGWSVSYDPEAGTVYLSTAVTGMIADWLYAEDLSRVGIAPGDTVAVLEHFFVPFDAAATFEPARVTSQMVGGRTLYIYEYQDAYEGVPYTGVLVAAESSDGSFFSGDVFPLSASSVDIEDIAEALRIVAGVEFPASSGATDAEVAEEAFALLDSGIGVTLIEGWTNVVDENGFLTLESAQTVFEPRWYFADELPALGIEAGDVPGVLADVASRLSLSFDPVTVSVTLSGGRSVWHVPYQIDERGGSYEAMLGGVLLEDGSVLTGFAYPAEANTLDERSDVLVILGSARRMEGSGAVLLSESFTFEQGGITFHFPATWAIEFDDDFAYLVSDLTFADPYYVLVEDLDATEVGDIVQGMASLWRSLYAGEGMVFDANAVRTQLVGERVVALYSFDHVVDGEAHEHLMTAVELDDASQFYLDAYPIEGSALVEADTLLSITAGTEIQAVMPTLGEEHIAIRLHDRN